MDLTFDNLPRFMRKTIRHLKSHGEIIAAVGLIRETYGTSLKDAKRIYNEAWPDGD